jgi:hypothetical protein
LNFKQSATAGFSLAVTTYGQSIILARDMAETEIIFSVQESPEGGFEARALGYSIFTQAETMDELKGNVREAVRCHFDEGKAPPVIRLHLVKDEVISA